MKRRDVMSSGAVLAAFGVARAEAAEPVPPPPADIAALLPDWQRVVAQGMADFDVPGAAIGIVADGKLVYSAGLGVRAKGSSDAVGAGTVFQIGSTTKAFLATTLAIAVDRGALHWNDRVVERFPEFMLQDPWVTREFRLFDILAQRSGLPPYANDMLFGMGYDPDWMVHSLRYVDPTSSFRSAFTYTNITHIVGGRIAAKALDAPDWPTLAKRELIDRLGMHDTSFTSDAIAAAPDHATGHNWTNGSAFPLGFRENSPYAAGPAGDINSTLADCATWLQFQIAGGVHDGTRLVSAANVSVTRTPRIAITETIGYGMGWILLDTPRGRVIYHNGGTDGFGAHIGFLAERGIGVIVLSNLANRGFPDAVALWVYDRLLGNPPTDRVAHALDAAKAANAKDRTRFTRPTDARPSPAPAALAGRYRSNVFGPGTLAADGEALTMTLEHTGVRLRFTPFDGATFTLRSVPDSRFVQATTAPGSPDDVPDGFASFEIGADGRLDRLRMVFGEQQFRWRKV